MLFNTQPLKKTAGKDTTFGEHLRQEAEKKKITFTKSLKGWIIEFFKVFCFVFAALITAQAKIKWTCVLKEINCVLLGVLCVVFVENGKGSEVVGFACSG